MKIQVQDILPTQPKVLHFVGKEPFLQEILGRLVADDVKPAVALPISNEIRADLEVARDGRNVSVTGDAHAVIHVPCARCLNSVTITLDPHIDLALLPAPKDEKEADEMELNPDELDDYTYKNDEIDVGAILNEQLLLEKPFKVVCAEECKGLCPSCGIDLNESLCTCTAPPKSLAFTALKDFKPSH